MFVVERICRSSRGRKCVFLGVYAVGSVCETRHECVCLCEPCEERVKNVCEHFLIPNKAQFMNDKMPHSPLSLLCMQCRNTTLS